MKVICNGSINVSTKHILAKARKATYTFVFKSKLPVCEAIKKNGNHFINSKRNLEKQNLRRAQIKLSCFPGYLTCVDNRSTVVL